MLVDSHCHLDYLEREGQDLDEVVGRAKRAGVGKLLTISTKLSEFEKVHGIAKRFAEVDCSVGVHPHEAGEEGQETPDRLIELAQAPEVIGIGETGLDSFAGAADKAGLELARRGVHALLQHTTGPYRGSAGNQAAADRSRA